MFLDQRLPSQGQDVDPSLAEVFLDQSRNETILTEALPGGTSVTILSRQADALAYPVVQIDHLNNELNGATSIVGGWVYRGTAASELQNLYLFGLLSSDAVFYADATQLANDEIPMEPFALQFEDESGNAVTLGQLVGNQRTLMRLGEDANGEVYIFSQSTGQIFALSGTSVSEPASLSLLSAGVALLLIYHMVRRSRLSNAAPWAEIG